MLILVLQCISVFLVILTTLCYAYQVIYLFVPFFWKKKPHKEEKQNRYAVLIAARNEEAVLPHLLDSIRKQDYPAELITTYVVADNCTDRTAELAAAHGAKVFTRFNDQLIGKGHALRYLLEQIQQTESLDQYDAFLIFDADNLLTHNYITTLNRTCSDGYEVFTSYRNSKNFGDNWLTAGTSLWYLHDCTHMNRSRMLLGNPCVIAGTGYGFTRDFLRRFDDTWPFRTLTEDIELSAWCATHGIRVGYNHDAIFYDEQPRKFGTSWKQRTRWAQGGIQVSVRYAKDMLKGLFKGGRTSYASLETITVSLWGYGTGALCGVMTMVVTYLSFRWMGIGLALIGALLSSYSALFAIGALTMLTEHKRVRATKKEKIMSLFTFPLFMLSFVPIAATALFRKFKWDPIEHDVAITAEDLSV